MKRTIEVLIIVILVLIILSYWQSNCQFSASNIFLQAVVQSTVFTETVRYFFLIVVKERKKKKNPLPPQQLLQFSDGSSNLPAFVQDVSIRMEMKRGEMESFNCWILQRKQWEELARVRSSEICCLQWFKVENVLSKIRERCDFHLFYYCCSCYLFEAHFILFLGSTVFPVSSNQLSWTV